MKLKTGASSIFRYTAMALILIFVTVLGLLHQQHQVKFPSVDALCPFGGLESLYSLIFTGKFLSRVFSSSLILLGITVVLALVSGRSFCGWICPLGTIQEFLNKLRNILIKQKNHISYKKDRRFRYLKYVVLIVFTFGAWYGGSLLIRPFEPWVVWMHLGELGHAVEEFPVGAFLLFALMTGSLFINRPFCRYLCPMGGFLALIAKVSPLKLKKINCISCSACNSVCPMGGEPGSADSISSSECIACGECVTACKKEKSPSMTIGKKKISPVMLGAFVIAFLFGVTGLTQAMGIYNSLPPGIEEIKKAGNLKPDNIKGYMTLADVAYLFDLKLEALYQELDLNPRLIPVETKSKDIAELSGLEFDTDKVRLAAARLLSIPEEQVAASCSAPSGSGYFISGTMTLSDVSQKFNIDIDLLYSKLEIKKKQVPPGTQCRQLKFIVSSDFHTTRVRAVVAEILETE